MNIQEYIESGILESYVLGNTTAEESVEVERLAEQYPAIEQEIALIRGSLEKYALQFAQNPPSALKNRVMDALLALEQDSAEIQEVAPNIIAFQPQVAEAEKPSVLRYAASWVLLALSIAANVLLYTRWQNSEEKVVALESKNQLFAQNEQILKANYQQEIAILQNPDIKKVRLGGQEAAPNAQAMVYWNAKTEEVYLSSLKLPVAPAGKQYQLWAIVDGKPVDAGLINDSGSFTRMKSLGNAVAFAISLEAEGGSTTEAGPKGQIFVLGNV